MLATALIVWQAVDQADVGSGIPGDHAVGLEGDKPALIPSLGGNFLAFQRIVCIIAVFESFEIDRNQHARPHEALG